MAIGLYTLGPYWNMQFSFYFIKWVISLNTLILLNTYKDTSQNE